MSSDGDADLANGEYRRLAEFRHALRLFLRFSEDAARSEGLTPHQHQLMLAVRGWPQADPPAISDLAEQLQLKVHSTGELARRAEAAGMVVLDTDPEDHRRQLVRLTTDGHAKLRSLSVLHRAELRRSRRHLTDLLDMLEDSPHPTR